MRWKIKKRKQILLIFKIITSLFLTTLCIICIVKYQSSPIHVMTKVKHNTKIIIVNSENQAIDFWLTIAKSYNYPLHSGTLVTINSHFNNGLFDENYLGNYNNIREFLMILNRIRLQSISSYLTSLFNQVIFIFPQWLDYSLLYQKKSIYIGIFNKNICVCDTVQLNYTCINIYPNSPSFIDADDCHIVSEKILLTTAQDVYAVDNDLQNKTLSDKGPLVIVIDFDFFTKRLLPLKENLDISADPDVYQMKRLQLEQQINRLFCVQHESSLNTIDVFLQQISLSKHSSGELRTVVSFLCKNLSAKRQRELLAQVRSNSQSLAQMLVPRLHRVGLCYFASAPSGQGRILARVCARHQLITHSAVTYIDTAPHHLGNKAEFQLQLDKLRTLLQTHYHRPIAVVISRNHKSGFISKHNAEFLEKKLVSMVTGLYNVSGSSSIILM